MGKTTLAHALAHIHGGLRYSTHPQFTNDFVCRQTYWAIRFTDKAAGQSCFSSGADFWPSDSSDGNKSPHRANPKRLLEAMKNGSVDLRAKPDPFPAVFM